MCGIAGILDLRGLPVPRGELEAMAAAVAHRGPDGAGIWCDGPIGFAHRRLAIIDLSPAAAQPMLTRDGQCALTYNGEIYNFKALRRGLEQQGVQFRSQSDSEVLLEGLAREGVAFIPSVNGMFAWGFWDRRTKRLHLARDRFGVKPLYIWCDGHRLAFASEVKALLTLPEVHVRLCSDAFAEYFCFQNVLSDLTLFEGIRILPPGCWLECEPGARPSVRRYWDFDFRPRWTEAELGEEEAKREVRRLFDQAVRRQLVADVPVGAYLSGGMDSGSIVAVASQSMPRLMTFTAGFDLSGADGIEVEFDERQAAELMARTFGTEHYEVVLHRGTMERVLRDVVWHLEDLRVGMSWQNFCAARLAGRFVKVVLAGTGGDELFAGYPWRYASVIAAPTPALFLDHFYRSWQRLVPPPEHRRFFVQSSAEERCRAVFEDCVGPLDTQIDGWQLAAAQGFEARTFLHGLLVVGDRLSMAHGLEERVPFLDNDLAAFAQALPVRYRLKPVAPGNGRPVITDAGKPLLRSGMRALIPEEIRQRPKQGFSPPDGGWYRYKVDEIRQTLCGSQNGIREWVQDGAIRRVLDEHARGQANHRLLIWSLLCFEHWVQIFLGPKKVAYETWKAPSHSSPA